MIHSDLNWNDKTESCYASLMSEGEQGIAAKLFRIGMWWRIGYGSLRVIAGLALLKAVGTPLIDIVQFLLRHELVEDPSDLFYTFIHYILGPHPVHVTYFLALYFVFWGTIDIVLSYNLLKGKRWAFPAAITLIGLFLLYEVARLIHTHSLILFGVIMIDLLILWLIRREYKKINTYTDISTLQSTHT